MKVKYFSHRLLDQFQISNKNKQWLEMKMTSNNALQILKIKTTSKGRQPQNNESEIFQPPLIGSNSNFKLELR